MPSESMINSQVEFSDNDLLVFEDEENIGEDREIGLDQISDWKLSKSNSKEQVIIKEPEIREVIKERVVYIYSDSPNPNNLMNIQEK